jgi:hypothetical protein
MTIDDGLIKNYLSQIHAMGGISAETLVSMYDAGIALGLEKAEAGSLAEELIVQGLIELHTLAGGVSLTGEGFEKLGLRNTVAAKCSRQLSKGPVASDEDHKILAEIVNEIRLAFGQLAADFKVAEELIIDLKTLEVQLLSPRPKISIIKSILGSCQNLLAGLKGGEVISTTLASLI